MLDKAVEQGHKSTSYFDRPGHQAKLDILCCQKTLGYVVTASRRVIPRLGEHARKAIGVVYASLGTRAAAKAHPDMPILIGADARPY